MGVVFEFSFPSRQVAIATLKSQLPLQIYTFTLGEGRIVRFILSPRVLAIGRMSSVFANCPGDQGSIPGRVHTKD